MSILKNRIPESKQSYLIQNGCAESYLWNEQVFNILATNESTNNMFEVVEVISNKNQKFPMHLHKKTYESILIIDGVLDIETEDGTHTLTRGDYVLIPPGTNHAYLTKAHRTRFLIFYIDGCMTDFYKNIGESYDFIKPPSYIEKYKELDVELSNNKYDILFDNQSFSNTYFKIVKSGEGENFLTGAEMHSLITTQKDTEGKYIVVSSEGPIGEPIISHYHEEHTEIFYCFEGKIKMFLGENNEEFDLMPGDFLHAPAGTIHSYKMDSNYTKMIGLLVPGLFEPFFRTLGEVYDSNNFPNIPNKLNIENIFRDIDKLDLQIIEPK